MSKVKNVTSEAGVLTALDEMSNLITEYQKENFKFLSGQPIASIQSGLIKPDAEGKIIRNAMQWLRDWLAANNHDQEFQNEQLGTVIIAPSGIKSAMSHKPKQIDIQGLPALPLIIEKARVLSRSMDDEGKPIENIVVAAPIHLDNEKCYMVVRLRRHTEDKNDKPRFYTQAVTIAKDIKKGNIPSDQVAGQNNLLTQNGGRSRLLNVLYEALNVNIEQKSKKIKVYGWKAIEMARNLTFEQLEILTLKTQKEHFIPKEQRTNIYLYDQKGRKKLDVLSWAVHHKLEEFKNNPNENDKPLDHEDLLRIRNEFQVDYEQGAFDGVDGFDSIDEDGQWVLDKIDSMIAVLQNLHGGENKVLKGRSNNVKTAKGTKVSTVFAVLEADKIIASHTATGAENPNYPQELQPRDRSRESSQAWVQKTSNTLDPESLGRSGRADTGAPIVGSDLVVESGNGRTMAIQLAYERENADEYKQWLIDEAEYFGFNADAIAQFNQPILVRIRTSDIDRIQFTVEANQDDKLSFSATERAKSDARRLDENLLSLFMPGDDGDLLTVANQKFIQGFLKSLGETEAAQYITKEGKPTQALVTRIKAAIFSKAYNDDRLLEMMADQTKPDLQNMLNALGAAAPKFIEAQSVSRGNVQDVSSSIVDGIEQALDKRVANAIIDAANTILAAKHNDQDIAEFVKQQGLFGDLGEGVPELAIFLSKNSRSAKKMSLLFKAMAEFAEKQALDQQNIGLFGDPEPVSIKDAIDYAVNIIEENYGENTNLSMFDSVDSIFTPTSFDQKAHEAATSPLNDLEQPSTEQKLSGEYQKGHLSIGDLNIAIENPAGSIRSGTDEQGNEWQITMQHHYGFIENTMGADGDEIDVFVKNHLDHIPDHAYIIKQLDKDGKFDEHKVILGAETEDEAKEIYLSNYEQGWQGFGDIKRISMADLLQKIQHTWSGFDSWATDGSYEHIPLNKIITDNAPKIHESKISKEDPIVVIEKLGKYHLIVGLGRLALAKQRRESFIPAIIFDANEVKDSIIQKAMKKAGVIVDPVALAALIVDELEKSLLHSFDSIEGNVTRDNVLDVIDQLIETVERFEIEQHQDQPHTHDEKQALELFESLGREGVMQRHEAIISIAQKRMDEWIKKQGGFDDSNLTAIDYMTDDERTEFHLLNLALSLGVNTQKEAQQKVQERLATRRGKNGITHIEGKQSEITTNDVVEESFSKAEANTEVSDADDHSVLGKMKAKLARLESEFDMIFSDQPFMGHGGTPFILDNSKGRQMKRNHDKREERLQAKKKQIEDQKEKIQNMEWRIASRNTQTKKSAKFIEKNPIHQGLFELEKLGLVKQWRKNPQYFFVNDLDKVALATFDGEIGFSKRFPVKTQAELDTVKALVAQANAFENVA